MTRPDAPPAKPRSVTAAQVLIWMQLGGLLCCGIAPIMVFWPAFFLVANIGALSALRSESLVWAVVGLELAIVIAYTVIATSWLGAGDRRGRTATAAATVVVIALAVAAMPAAASLVSADAYPWFALASAAPSIGFQAVAWVCLYSASAERWFQSGDDPADPG